LRSQDFIENVQVANMNVSTLWFNSMYMSNANAVTFGCMNVDETEADVGGGLKVNGETNFMGDVKVGRGWGGGGRGSAKESTRGPRGGE
jgi:hypothetical protein